MQFDHLSTDKLWDLVYNTAKNKKRQKKLWKELMAPEYADVVRKLAQSHVKRIDNDIREMQAWEGASTSDPDVQQMIKARDFISKIMGQATHAMEDHVARGRNIRKYARIQDLIDYTEYLKDTIEDLRDLIPDSEVDFRLHTSIESFENPNSEESDLDTWLTARKERRGSSPS